MSSTNVSKCEGILVISCDQLPPEDVIQKILGVNSLPNSVCNGDIKGYPWSFETKYYSAEVHMYALNTKVEFDSKFSESIRAVVFYFDCTKSSSFDDVISWMPTLKSIEAEVQLLICNNTSEDSDEPMRKNILNWCVQNQYELVELNSFAESDEEECSIKDFKGYERVVQALQSHPWANLIMKDEKYDRKYSESEGNTVGVEEILENSGESACSNIIANESDSKDTVSAKESKKVCVGSEALELEDQWLSNVLNGEDPGGESFEALFAKFASMKDKASGLSGDDRKKYAEKVAVAFWRAMGGDEDEIDGLDDD